MKRLILSLLFIGFFSLITLGQEVKPQLKVENLKPVDELLNLAVERSSAIKALNITQQQTDQEISIDRKKWLQHISVAAGVNYGNGIVADQLTGDQSGTSLTYLTRQNVTYNVGLNIRLPFTEVSSRKNELKIKGLEKEKIDQLKNQQIELLQREIVQLYADLKHLITSIEIKAELQESNEMALKVAEGYFKAGKLALEQYRMAVESHYSAKLAFERAKNDAWLAYTNLKNIVGQDILK